MLAPAAQRAIGNAAAKSRRPSIPPTKALVVIRATTMARNLQQRAAHFTQWLAQGVNSAASRTKPGTTASSV